MARILLIEDSRTFARLIQHRIENRLGFEVDWVTTYAEAKALLEEKGDAFFIALTDLSLPDTEGDEIIDLLTERNLPSIVFTGDTDLAVRENIWTKRVVDFVLKENVQNVDYIVSLIYRIYANKTTKVLVVDDSVVSRHKLVSLLKVHQYQVLEAADGKSAIAMVNEHPDIQMMTVDYVMPDMDGCKLTEFVRNKRSREEIAIIGVSGQGGGDLSARFIRSGANDFINKPFSNEEFYCRITQNMQLLEMFKKVKESSIKDFLTGLHNRRFFFDLGAKIYKKAQRTNSKITVAMLDIDHFKKVNDTHGHDVGDKVIKKVADVLSARFRESDVVSRFGGEEFCVLASDIEPDQVKRIFDEVREAIERAETVAGKVTVKVTISVGVAVGPRGTLDEMVKLSDKVLYEAKSAGRNCVIVAS